MTIKKGAILRWNHWEVKAIQNSFVHEGVELVAVHAPQLEGCFYCVPVDYLQPPAHQEQWVNFYFDSAPGSVYATKEACDRNRNTKAKRSHYLRVWQATPGSRWKHEEVELDGEYE